jgi:hypothetical protein
VPRLGLRSLVIALGLAALLCPVPQAAASDALMDAWPARISAAYQQVADAHQRAETAHNTYQDWRQRKYPRGMRKEELVREVDDADRAVLEAEAKFAGVLEQARRDGVPPGVLREYEQ